MESSHCSDRRSHLHQIWLRRVDLAVSATLIGELNSDNADMANLCFSSPNQQQMQINSDLWDAYAIDLV